MAFTIDQGMNHSQIGCLASDHNSVQKSFVSGYSSLNKDAKAKASDCFVLSNGLETCNQLVPSSPFSLGMSYEQVQETNDGSCTAGGSSTPVAPCTPCPPFLQQRSLGQKVTKTAHALPSLCLGIGFLEGQQAPCIQKLRTPEKPYSSKEFLKQLSAGPPQSTFITPMQGHETQLEVQRETPEAFKEAQFVSKLTKSEQYWQEFREPHSVLSLGNVKETLVPEESPANSRNPRFSFLEALTAGDSQLVQESGYSMHNRLCLSEGIGCLQPSAESPNNFESILNKFSKQSNTKVTSEQSLPWESSQQMKSSLFVSHANNILVDPEERFLNAACTVSSPPLARQEWSTTFKRFPHLYQALSQDKNMPASACEERRSPEKRRRLLSAQENYASGASDTRRELSRLPIDADRQKNQSFEQLNVREALEALSSQKTNDCNAQPPDNFCRPVSLAKVKVENDYEESFGGQYAHRDSVEENDVTGRWCNSKPPPGMCFLGSSCAGMSALPKGSLMDVAGNLQHTGTSNSSVCSQMPQVLLTISAAGPSVCLSNEQTRQLMDLEERTPPINRTSQIGGCWGKFLALSASGGEQQMVKGDATEVILPFQRRFKQLQDFLKQCDTSDKYSLQAFQSLSAAAMNGSAVELETRAVRLSLEEGKELKRMKRLNVLGRASEGGPAFSRGVYGTQLHMPGTVVQVKQEL